MNKGYPLQDPNYNWERRRRGISGDSLINTANSMTDEQKSAFCEAIGAEGSKAPNANGHEYVDLGLPSGTLWAAMNVGASSPELLGDYFAWGETETKGVPEFDPISGACTNYTWDNYKYGTGESDISKYNSVDNKKTLDVEDDAVAANMGGDWRMPTLKQWEELKEFCSISSHTDDEDRYDYDIYEGSNGNTLILPRMNWGSGSDAVLWSAQRDSEYEDKAVLLRSEDSIEYRIFGFNVRGVLNVEKKSEGDGNKKLVTPTEDNTYEVEGGRFLWQSTSAGNDFEGNIREFFLSLEDRPGEYVLRIMYDGHLVSEYAVFAGANGDATNITVHKNTVPSTGMIDIGINGGVLRTSAYWFPTYDTAISGYLELQQQGGLVSEYYEVEYYHEQDEEIYSAYDPIMHAAATLYLADPSTSTSVFSFPVMIDERTYVFFRDNENTTSAEAVYKEPITNKVLTFDNQNKVITIS